MKTSFGLLATVSLFTLLAVDARADDAGLGVVVEATGAYVMGPDSAATNVLATTTVTGLTAPDITSGYAALRVGKQFMPMWDLTGRAAATRTNTATANYTFPAIGGGPDKLGTVTSDLAFQTLDLELGYTPILTEGNDLRVFGGLRGLHFTESETDAGFLTSTMTDEYYGVGPRVGFEFSHRFGDSPIGVSATASGAVIGGSNHRITSTFLGTTTTDSSLVVVDLESSAGLDLHAGDNVTLTGGYRAEFLSGVNNFNASGASGQLVSGPFARIRANF